MHEFLTRKLQNGINGIFIEKNKACINIMDD